MTADRYSLEGADRITVGTSDVTMRIWLLVDQLGDNGMSRDEIATAVMPHINAGYAKRRYRKHLERTQIRRRDVLGMAVARTSPAWEDVDVASARSYVISKTLANMKRDGSLVNTDGRYLTGRKPRYRMDERVLDLTGDITRLHMNGSQAIRTLEPAIQRHQASPRANLRNEEWVALERLVELYREAMRNGFRLDPGHG